tara:strand:+ start:92 stop:316 length:225 start_codon:yes stop_codon:yes gene_type:complete
LWKTTSGKFPDRVFEDNLEKWSGDHLMNAGFVPGILIGNKKIKVDEPTLVDFAPTILAEFGVPKDPNIVGRKLF